MTAKRLVTLVFFAWPGLAAAQDPVMESGEITRLPAEGDGGR